MRCRKIVARWRKKKDGQKVAYVRTPSDQISKFVPRERFFQDPQDAEQHAKNLSRARLSLTGEFDKLSGPQKAAIIRGLERIGADNLLTAIALFEERKPMSELGIRQIVTDCLKESKESGTRLNSLATLKYSLNSFADFCSKSIGAVTTADVKAWIDSHPDWTNKTKLGRIVDLSTMFKYARRQKIISENPCDDVKRPKVDQRDHKIFHVAEAKVLLETIQAHDVALLGYVCPDLLGGLRPFESKRIKAKNVSAGRIRLDATQTKKRRSRTVHFNPALKAFLSVPGVQFEHKNLVRRMRKIRKLAGEALSKLRGKKAKFPWAHDIVRHTFCSNAVHEFGFKETSKLACTSEDNLRTTYFTDIENLDEVKEFWAMRPDQKIRQNISKPKAQLTRTELYNKVWSVPTLQLADELGISNVAIAKRCKKLNVPKPPLGYWAKIEAGQKPEQSPLPPEQ